MTGSGDTDRRRGDDPVRQHRSHRNSLSVIPAPGSGQVRAKSCDASLQGVLVSARLPLSS